MIRLEVHHSASNFARSEFLSSALGQCHVDFVLSVFACATVESSLSLRGCARLDSGLSLCGEVGFGSALTPLDFADVGSLSLLRSFSRTQLSSFAVGVARIGSSLSVSDCAFGLISVAEKFFFAL